MLRRLTGNPTSDFSDGSDRQSEKISGRKIMVLFRLIEKSKWEKLKKYLKTNSHVIPHTRDPSGLTPLALAVSSNAPLDVIEILVAADKKALGRTDDFGATPLHLACLNGTTPGIVRFLLKADNGAASRSVDNDNYTVLHHAVEYVCLLIERRYFNRNSAAEDSCSDSIASEHDDYLEIIKILCKKAPDMVHMATKDNGDTPLDIPQIIRVKRNPPCKPHDYRLLEVYQLLRETSIFVYREKKLEWERLGVSIRRTQDDEKSNCDKSLPSLLSSQASSAFSGLSNLRDSKISCQDHNNENMSVG